VTPTRIVEEGPTGVCAGPFSPRGHPGVGRRRRPVARPVDDGRHPLGASVVRDLVERRRRRDDGVLCRCSVPADRREANRFETRQADRQRRRRAVWAVVCTPPYLLGRVGLLMLGSRALLIPGIVVLALGATLQAGATGAVKAVKMSAKLVAPDGPKPHDAAVPGDPSPQTEVGGARTRRDCSIPQPVGQAGCSMSG
jgi:hypothetical protein